MKYPLITEYVEAVRSAAENLDDHDSLLASLRPVMQEGRPFYSSGNYAVVFKMKAPDGRLYAMKCWHKEMPGRDERYDLIAEELDSVQSSYLLGVRYCAEGLFVDSATADGELFPVLLMDWVEGTPLDAYLRTHRHDGYALGMVAHRFGLMAQWLMGQSFAHGDLKPDNILVRPDGTLVLVDYDGMFVPAMRGMAALECGTPNFRHPARTAQQFDDHIDDFTLAHIAAALKAVALQPALLDAMPQDALLFTDDDFRDLAHSPVLSTLQALLADAEMARLTGLLLIAHAEGSLSQPMQPLFRLARPQKVEEVLSTKVTKEDLENAIEDEYGVKYSPDGKRLLRRNGILGEYQVRLGTKVICDSAFSFCDSLQSITLPDSVTHIGDRAFWGCKSLQSITLPDSVTHIGGGAFCKCSSLQSITLPDSVTHIGDNAFGLCDALQSITLPDSVTHIGDHAFIGCKSLQSITLPDSVTHIGASAFVGCSSLQSITLPDSVTHIGDNAFFKCESLQSITLPDSVTHIGDSAFEGCGSLQRIVVPKGCEEKYREMLPKPVVKELVEEFSTKVTEEDLANAIEDEHGVKYSPDGKRLLKGKWDLKEYQVRPGTKVICDEAFRGRESLRAITLPDSVTHIGNSAFYDCRSLVSITLPNSVTHIGTNPFEDSGIKEIISHSVHFKVQDSCLYNADGTHLITYFGDDESITLPDSVTHIGDRAFDGCKSLESITLPDSVTHIGSNPFACSGIKEIISHSVHFKVQGSGLYNADGTHLITYFSDEESVTLPDSVTHIGNGAFAYCSLREITLPDSVMHIGNGAFQRCESLQEITLPDSVTHIGNGAFSGCKSLRAITLPDSVTHIGDFAFYACESLESITLPESVTHIGDHAFDGCTSLRAITLPESVTHIGDSAFLGCLFLRAITLPDSVTHIGDSAFYGCWFLQEITLPDSVTHIGDSAFGWCESLKSITLPDSVTHIGDGTFGGCDSLQRIVVPKGCGEKYRKMLPEYQAKIVEES